MRLPITRISVVGLLALTPGLASANPLFPGTIQTDLALSSVPQCTICHSSNGGGAGTVVKAFGIAMRAKGLMDPNTSTVQTALDGMEAAKVDSDCDGTTDVDQLKEGRDPNTGLNFDGTGTMSKGCSTGDGGTTTSAVPVYGCGATSQIAASSTLSWFGAAAVAASLGLSVARRRRRR